MQIQKHIFTFLLLFSLLYPIQTTSIIHIPILGDIDMGLPYYIERGIEFAHNDSAKLIILEIDTFGGRVDAATKIKDLILVASTMKDRLSTNSKNSSQPPSKDKLKDKSCNWSL